MKFYKIYEDAYGIHTDDGEKIFFYTEIHELVMLEIAEWDE